MNNQARVSTGREALILKQRGRFNRASMLAIPLTAILLAAFVWGCDGSSSKGNAPEDVAKRAMQAAINGDTSAWLEELRPDERAQTPYQVEMLTDAFTSFQGCTLDDAEYLESDQETFLIVTIVFSSTCVDDSYSSCELYLSDLGERWYTESGHPNSHCR